MKLETVKLVSIVLLVLMFALVIAGRLILGISIYLSYAALGILTVVLAMILIWGRCPHCGKHLFLGFFKLQDCPRCRKSLTEEQEP